MIFPWVQLGEVATPVERPVQPTPGVLFRQIGVRLWGEGAYEREPLDGANTKYSVLHCVEADDIIVNKIWARNGSVAVVPMSLAGSYCSGEFPLFRPKAEALDPRWFHWITKTPWFWSGCDELSQGTSGKNRIRPERFLGVKIPLPSLAEQRRLVTKIEILANKIVELNRTRKNVHAEYQALCRSMIFSSRSVLTPMRHLVCLRQPDVGVCAEEMYGFAGVYCFGGGVFRGQVKAGTEFAYKLLTRIRHGDFLYPKLMAWEGALGAVPQDCAGLVVSPEFPVFEVNCKRVLPEVLDVYFRSPSVWPQLASISTGTNVRRRRLHPSAFLNYKIPLPPMDIQERMCAMKQRIDQIAAIRAVTDVQLDALLPSILDKAFKGEL